MNENINTKDLFSVGVKIIGLLSFGRGVLDLLTFLLYWIGLSYTSVTSDQYLVTLKMGSIYLVGGLYLLRGAKTIVNFAYPNKLFKDSSSEDAESSARHD